MKTKYGVEIPVDASGKPVRDDPMRYVSGLWNQTGARQMRTYISPKNALAFEFDGSGEWEAESRFTDGVPFTWRIVVCEDGTFDVSESTRELLGIHKPATFSTFIEAVAFCDEREGNSETYTYADPQDV